MKFNYNVQGKEKKALVNIIAEVISEEAVYAKPPTYAYHIGAFTVTREGVLEFDCTETDKAQVKAVIEALTENGYEYDGADSLSISYPMEGFTDESLANLEKMVASKAPLIKKAIGVDELPIERGETELTFPWFSAELTSDETYAYAQFITQLCKTAKEKSRVTAKEQDSFENEKFALRVWMIGLDMKGSEYALARKLMLKNLDGDSSWRYGKPENGATKPRGERVHKEAISIRLTPETLETLSELASQTEGNISRNMLIESIITEYIQAEGGETASAPEGNEDGEVDGNE